MVAGVNGRIGIHVQFHAVREQQQEVVLVPALYHPMEERIVSVKVLHHRPVLSAHALVRPIWYIFLVTVYRGL